MSGDRTYINSCVAQNKPNFISHIFSRRNPDLFHTRPFDNSNESHRKQTSKSDILLIFRIFRSRNWFGIADGVQDSFRRPRSLKICYAVLAITFCVPVQVGSNRPKRCNNIKYLISTQALSVLLPNGQSGLKLLCGRLQIVTNSHHLAACLSNRSVLKIELHIFYNRP